MGGRSDSGSGGLPANPEAVKLTRPRLYFSAEEVAALRTRAGTSHAALWAELKAYCDEHAEDQPPAILPGETYDDKGQYLEANFLSRITNFSLAYVIGRNPRDLAAAKLWVLTLARTPEWAGRCGNRPDAGLYAGFGEMSLSVGYDWLHHELAPAERALVRSKLAAIAANLYEAAQEGEWWTGAYWHHDMIIPVTGLGIAALALSGEDSEAARWLERAVQQVEMVFDRIGDDGAWHEGASPWAWGTMTMLMFLDALERQTGRTFWATPWLRETAYYRLYCWLPPAHVVNFDDSHRDGGYATLTRDCAAILYRLAHQYRNPYAQWLGDLDAAAKKNEASIAWRFLWRDATIEPRSPEELPSSRFFADQDLVIARAGWGESDPVLAFTCGATVGRRALSFATGADGSTNQGLNTGSNHTHPDQLSFMVYANGDYLIAPQGYGYYDASEENSILVDGRGPRYYADSSEPILDAGRAEHLVSAAGLDAVVGQAAACYPHDLGVEQAERRLSYIKPYTIVLSDLVVLKQPRSVEWRLHAGPGVTIERKGADYWFAGPRAALRLVELFPTDLQISIGRGGRRKWDEKHEWLSLRLPRAAGEANLRILMYVTVADERHGALP